MRKILLVSVLCFFTLFQNVNATEGIAKPKIEVRELEQEENISNYYKLLSFCYNQTTYADCGTLHYTVCFQNEPSLEFFLAVIDEIDNMLNNTCIQP
ncbi:hypothetical protein CAP36_17005 [Chitinophagaceae bacterium IBVUCB2]|nr:hypothetical protein CAP36_17005 [Chitinophagaceae bacterium IBVUCB2]